MEDENMCDVEEARDDFEYRVHMVAVKCAENYLENK